MGSQIGGHARSDDAGAPMRRDLRRRAALGPPFAFAFAFAVAVAETAHAAVAATAATALKHLPVEVVLAFAAPHADRNSVERFVVAFNSGSAKNARLAHGGGWRADRKMGRSG